MKVIVIVVSLILSSNLASCRFPNVYPKIKSGRVLGDPGEPLFLTPLIEANRIEEARTASEVHLDDFQNISSYAGYLTVDKTYSSNLFFWFFPAQENYETAPVVLWLQGGPGSSSLFGLFTENGPFELSTEDIRLRQYSWTKPHSVIYIDNPVGTGFSFTEEGYAQNETKVGEDLYSALYQFFMVFSEIRGNDFFVTGESYAGKFITAVSYTIHRKNTDASMKINLKGLAIGNGMCSPEFQIQYGAYLYYVDLIDLNTRNKFEKLEDQVTNYIKSQEYEKAFEVFDKLLNGDLTSDQTLYETATGFDNYFNYLKPVTTTEDHVGEFLSRDDVRAALHVGNQTFGDDQVEENLVHDFMQSVTGWLVELLDNYRVLIYNGQLDVILAYPMTVSYLQNLVFNGAEEYKTAERRKWYVGEELAGYFKQAGNLTEVLVRDAGHMVPTDQPVWALDLITKFVRNISLSNTNENL